MNFGRADRLACMSICLPTLFGFSQDKLSHEKGQKGIGLNLPKRRQKDYFCLIH